MSVRPTTPPLGFVVADSHNHIDLSQFDGDRAEAVARAHAAGVQEMLIVGGVDEENGHRRAIAIADELGVPASAGVHPHEAKVATEATYDELRALARDGKIELRQTVTRETATEWAGPRGRIGRAEIQPLVHDPATLCFVCGPPALVDEMPKILADLGIPRTRIRVEEWG